MCCYIFVMWRHSMDHLSWYKTSASAKGRRWSRHLQSACPCILNRCQNHDWGWRINTGTTNHLTCMPQSRTTPTPVIMQITYQIRTISHIQAVILSIRTGLVFFNTEINTGLRWQVTNWAAGGTPVEWRLKQVFVFFKAYLPHCGSSWLFG